MQSCDFLVIGAGIAGAYAGDALAGLGSVVILEMEDRPGYHTTGRSAAIYSETYGNRTIRALTTASKEFFGDPPDGFTEVPLVTPRGALHIGRKDQQAAVNTAFRENSGIVHNLRLLDQESILSLVPVVRPEMCFAGYLEPDCHDIDVDALHQGFLKSCRRQGGELKANAEAVEIKSMPSGWEVKTRSDTFSCGVVVNAAGAWADGIAEMAGLRAVHLSPLRRTALIFDPNLDLPFENWPLVVSIDEGFYFKPAAGLMMATPGDEIESPPCDAQPDEIDIAAAIDRLQAATTLRIRSITRKWAGLRTFAPDRAPVIGPDPENEKFFWAAGQGGYGMQTAPAIQANISALMNSGELSAKSLAIGLEKEEILPDRLKT